MGPDLGGFLPKPLNLTVHYFLLLIDEVDCLVLVQFNEVFLADLNHDLVEVICDSFHKELTSNIDPRVHGTQLLLAHHF